MQNLLIELKNSTGTLKTWKLRPEQSPFTFGQSRHAVLRVSIPILKGIQGIVENRDSKWFYIDLDPHSSNKDTVGSEHEVLNNLQINIGDLQLCFTLLDEKKVLFLNLSDELSKTSSEKRAFQIFQVMVGSKIVASEVLPYGQKFSYPPKAPEINISPEQSINWVHCDHGNYQIKHRTVFVKSENELQKFSTASLVDQEARKTLKWTLGGGIVLALLFAISPKENILNEALTPPPLVPRSVQVELKKKSKAPTQPVAETQPIQNQAANTVANDDSKKNSASATPERKSASLIKNLASGRISALIGKVAASAKSAQIIISKGQVAGTGSTGRALAAIGNISKSGSDWSKEGQGQGVQISTSGAAGGNGTSGMGTISSGKAGTGGVGLIEDESEVIGGLDREVIAAYIKSQLGQILYCYERQLSAKPDLFGKVAIKFTITGTGLVELHRILTTTLKDPLVENCILQKVGLWKFPAPTGGTKVLVTYPFLFKSTN